jgi:hypothetical protein
MNVTVVVHGATSTDEARIMNSQVAKMDQRPAFYCVSSSGLYGWAYVDLGVFSYEYAEPGNAGVTLQETVHSSDFSDFLDQFKKKASFSWTRREMGKP